MSLNRAEFPLFMPFRPARSLQFYGPLQGKLLYREKLVASGTD